MPKAQNVSWESTSTPSLFKALSKRSYFSKGKQPAIDSLMLGFQTLLWGPLDRVIWIDRFWSLVLHPPFYGSGSQVYLSFFCSWLFVGVFKLFVAATQRRFFMNCNAQEGFSQNFRGTQNFSKILLWVIRFWERKKKGWKPRVGNRTVASWATCYTVACEGQSYVSPRIYGVGRSLSSRSLRQEKLTTLPHCGKKNTPKQKIPEI